MDEVTFQAPFQPYTSIESLNLALVRSIWKLLLSDGCLVISFQFWEDRYPHHKIHHHHTGSNCCLSGMFRLRTALTLKPDFFSCLEVILPSQDWRCWCAISESLYCSCLSTFSVNNQRTSDFRLQGCKTLASLINSYKKDRPWAPITPKQPATTILDMSIWEISPHSCFYVSFWYFAILDNLSKLSFPEEYWATYTMLCSAGGEGIAQIEEFGS